MNQKLRKMLIGIRSQQRLFRVLGMGGAVVDSLLDMRGTKGIEEDYFEQIASSIEKDNYEVFNEKKGNSCRITLESIIISKKAVDDEAIDIKKFQKNVNLFYGRIREILQIIEVNRIGIIYEFETEIDNFKNVNKFLHESFLNYNHTGIPSNFTLKMGYKLPSQKGMVKPDVKDYYNIIPQFGVKYDEERNPIEDMLFVSVDIQRYFYPPAKTKNGNLIDGHLKYSEGHVAKFIREMKEKGLEFG